MFRGQRRPTSSRQAQWKRSFSAVALGVVTTAALVVAIGSTPAAAKTTRHRGTAAKAFTLPAENAQRQTVCEPSGTNDPCPRTNDVWSGYVLTPGPGDPFTSVSANWIQTAARCPKPNAWALFWVGLDGWDSFESQTVEQGGTSAECVDGVAQYQAWWEMYPTNSVQLTFPIAVGDHISASVVYSSSDSTYTITVTDTTSGDSLVAVSGLADSDNPNTYTVTVTENGVATTTGPTDYAGSVCNVGMPCQNTSAEWVVEAPGGDGSPGSLYPLAHFRRVTFTSATATDDEGDTGSISDSTWSDVRVNLTTVSGTYLASTTGLKKSGTQFRDLWDPGQDENY